MTGFSVVKVYSEELLTVLNGKNNNKHNLKYLQTLLDKLANKPKLGDFVNKTWEGPIQPSSMVKISMKERNPL